MDAGLKLKKTRESLGLRYRQVEQASNLIAQRHRNLDYVVGLSRLADIENKGVVPVSIDSTAFVPFTVSIWRTYSNGTASNGKRSGKTSSP